MTSNKIYYDDNDTIAYLRTKTGLEQACIQQWCVNRAGSTYTQ
jgi:hypothetical protein